MTDPGAVRQTLRSRVGDYMTSNPQTLEAGQTLLDAVLLLRRSDLRHIPILENGQLVGIMTDRDVGRFAPSILQPLTTHEYNQVFEDTLLRMVMTRNPLSTSPDAPLSEAVSLLFKNRLGCLPVLDQGQLVGIITVTDMLRALHDLIVVPAAEARSSEQP